MLMAMMASRFIARALRPATAAPRLAYSSTFPSSILNHSRAFHGFGVRPYCAQNPPAGIRGLLKIWPQSAGPSSPLSATKFNSRLSMLKFSSKSLQTSNKSKLVTLASRRTLLTRCSLGTSALAALIFFPRNIAYADGNTGLYDQNLSYIPHVTLSKTAFNSLWNMFMKYWLVSIFISMIVLGWKNPAVLLVSLLSLLYCTRPDPFSIYLHVDKMQERERERFGLPHSKLKYATKVHVEDYKLFSFGRVDVNDKSMHLVGLLDGWWSFDVRDDVRDIAECLRRLT